MRRGITSTILYILPPEVPVAEVVDARISVRQGKQVVINRPLSQMEIDDGNNTLGIRLTQEEALRLSDSRRAEVQLKVKLIGGNILATPICQATVHSILSEEVL